VRKTIHISIDKLSEIAENFDAIIVGSDQVWRREYMPDVETYFLEFGNNRIRKISYAASLGVNDWLFDRAETELISSLLAKFNAISVREHSAVSILKQQVGVDAVRVCDPTLLLNSDQYRLLSDAPPNEGEEISRIFTYILDSESAPEGMLASLVEEIGGEVLDIMPRLFGPGFQKDPVDYVYPPIEAWLNAFNECKFVITDSFHGCVFSLIFNRPFIAIANVERGKTRFESLLERYGLTDRLFSSLNDVDVKTLPPVDWVHVNKIRTEEQQDSLAFLRAALLDK
jgi:polysaccharide pyruvyl transferase WcaK-like protein